jgi:hypothetical protein
MIVDAASRTKTSWHHELAFGSRPQSRYNMHEIPSCFLSGLDPLYLLFSVNRGIGPNHQLKGNSLIYSKHESVFRI